MNPENKQFIDDSFSHFLVLERAFYLRGLSGTVRLNMQRVISEEFHPGYSADLWCPQCAADMVLKLYRHYHDWLKRETGSTETYKDLSEGIETMNKIYNHATNTV